jgi:hypothetical protein
MKDKGRMMGGVRAKRTIIMRCSILMMMECYPHRGGKKANEQERKKFPIHQANMHDFFVPNSVLSDPLSDHISLAIAA